MRSRRTIVALAPALALTLSCSDGTGPANDLEQFVLAFCASELPAWFAYQNEGEEWTRVQPNANNAFVFDASPRVGLAFTYDFGNEFFTDVYYATADEIRPLSGIACTETAGTRNVTGSVANVPVGSRASVSMSGSNEVVTAPAATFTVSGTASGPQDLVAHRELLGTSGATPNRVIIRRAINPVSSISPALDFGSEGQATATHTALITGLLSNEDNSIDIFFSTATGTSHTLYNSPFFTTSSQTLYGVPSTMTQAGDIHRIELNADGLNSYRSVFHWTRIPGDKAFTLGSSLNVPSVTKVTSTPYARMRISLASQTEYDDFVTAFFIQESAARSFYVTVTAAYVDGPITQWMNEVPDLTPAGGFPTADAGLANNTNTDWYVEAYDGSLAAFIGGTPVDGATVRYAGRANAVSTMQMNVQGARRQSAMRRELLRRAFSK